MEFISSISTTADHKVLLTEAEEQEAVDSLRKLIQFPTVSGTGPVRIWMNRNFLTVFRLT